MAKNCAPLQKSIAWCMGTPELPGIRDRIYYIAKQFIVSYPKLTKDSLGRPTSSVAVGDFVLQADQSFKYIDIDTRNSTATSEAQGEQPSQTQLNKMTAVHPGVGEDATCLAAYVNNADILYLFQDMKGNWRILGNDMYTTKSTVKQDLGQGATGTCSTTLEVEVTDIIAMPYFKGSFESEEGTIDCSGTGTGAGNGD